MDLNHRSSGHEPDEITKLLHAATGITGFEPVKIRQSKCRALTTWRYPYEYFNFKADLHPTIINKIVYSATQPVSLSFGELPLTSYQSLKDQNL